jgi:Domain of unknown function (DUF397)
MSTEELSWFKSSYSSGGGGNCVEVAVTPEAVHIRDSKAPNAGTLMMAPTVWSAFAALAAGSRLDRHDRRI